VSKGHRVKVKHEFERFIFSRNMSARFERQVRNSELYAEMIRLNGQAMTEKLLDDCPRTPGNPRR